MFDTKLPLKILLLLSIQVVGLAHAAAQLPVATKKIQPTEQETTNREPEKQTPSLLSPHATLTNFFDASDSQNWADAAKCLDFSELPDDLSASVRNDLAFRLKEVIDRLEYIDLRDVPTDGASDSSYRIPRYDPNAPIRIARGEDANWMFTADSVAKIGELYDTYRDKPRVAGKRWLTEWFRTISPAFTETVVLIPNYQWVCLLLLVLLGFVADALTRLVLRHATATWFRIIKAEDKYELQHKLLRPMGLLAHSLTWYIGAMLIGLPPRALSILLVCVSIVAAVGGIWTAYRLIDVLCAHLAARAEKTQTKFDDLMVPLIATSLKVVSTAIGLVVCAEAFHLPVTGLLGGLGIGGAALAFASKDTISNFFGSVTVMTDRPFELGDWIITEGVEGTVEMVGFRSTRLRTFYDSQITLPNSLLTTAVVDNMGRRRYRRIKTMIGLQYDTTPEQMEAFCEGIRELIRRHPYTRKDYYHVYLNAFGDSAIQVLLYCFLDAPDWAIELREKHRLYVDIMKLAESLDVSFAFPTRTVHLFNEQPLEHVLPFDGSAPASSGQLSAAEIAGPLEMGDRRPGPVEFTGPTDTDAM